MAKIIRNLKNVEWLYDDDTDLIILSIKDANGERINAINIDRIRAFSLSRFLIRIFQRMGRKRRKRKEGKV